MKIRTANDLKVGRCGASRPNLHVCKAQYGEALRRKQGRTLIAKNSINNT